ncbi:hypothetical protein HDU84_002436 [Entophlyctis sp. JEL0112]|nr:hypothetical protein HDU84_002436 [Entophlyctis sp. JEL0112]
MTSPPAAAAGALLFHRGASLSDVAVRVRADDADAAWLRLHSLVLQDASAFFAARLAPPWRDTTDEDAPICVALDSDNPLMPLALEILYTNDYSKVGTVREAAQLLAAFHFLAADKHIAWCCRYLARECITHNDIATLRQLKDAYPSSHFFSESTGVLSSNMTAPDPSRATQSAPQNPNGEKITATNSMTVRDLGVLIAKSSTKTGSKFLSFIQTEINENERLHFHESNGLAIIRGFETVLLDMETHLNNLRQEAEDDSARLDELEAETVSSDSDSDLEAGWRDQPNRAAGFNFGIPANNNIPDAGFPQNGDGVGENRRRRDRARLTSMSERRQEHSIRVTKARHAMARRRAKREKQAALVKHNFITQSLRLFKLFPFAGLNHKLIILDSWTSTGHKVFCESAGSEDEQKNVNDDEFDTSDDDSDSFDEHDLDETDGSTSDVAISDSDRLTRDSVGNDVDEMESFVLNDERQFSELKGKLSRTGTLASDSEWEEEGQSKDVPNARRSTVTISNIREYSSDSVPHLTSILAPQPVRAHSPVANLLSNEGVVTFRQDKEEIIPAYASPGLLPQSASPAEQASLPPLSSAIVSNAAGHASGIPAPPASPPAVSGQPANQIATTASTTPILGSAFRSNPSLSTSTTHLNFNLKTKIKTTASTSFGGGSSTAGGGAPSTSGSVSGRQILTPPPPMSPNQLRPRKLGSSVSNSDNYGLMGSLRFYHSVNARVAAQLKLEKCIEFVLAELCAAANSGSIDDWIENGGGDALRCSVYTRKELRLAQMDRGTDDSDGESSDESVHNEGINRGQNRNRRRPPASNITSDSELMNNLYTDDIINLAKAYGLPESSYTIINIFVCLFDIMQAVTFQTDESDSHNRHHKNQSQPSSRTSRATARTQTTAAVSTPARPMYNILTRTASLHHARPGDLTVRDCFTLSASDRLDAHLAGILAGVTSVRVRQFLIKAVLVDHDLGVGKRTARAIMESMKAANAGMKGKVSLYG